MTRVMLVLVCAALAAATVYTVRADDDVVASSVRTRAKRATATLIQRGARPKQAVAFVAARLGLDERIAKEEARKVYGRKGREAASRRVEHVGFMVPTTEVVVASEVLAWALCYPLADCDDNESLADCRTRGATTFEPALSACLVDERKAFSAERYCTEGSPVEVGRGARVRLTGEQWRKMVEARRDVSLPRTRVVRGASDVAYRAAQRAMRVERCPEDSPL